MEMKLLMTMTIGESQDSFGYKVHFFLSVHVAFANLSAFLLSYL